MQSVLKVDGRQYLHTLRKVKEPEKNYQNQLLLKITPSQKLSTKKVKGHILLLH